RAMRFAPDERYQGAADMLDEMRPLLPQGWAIEEAMFKPLGDADRGTVQPRLLTQPDVPVGRSGRTHPGARTGSGAMALSGGGTQQPRPARGGAGYTPMPASSPIANPSAPPGSSSLQGFGTTVGNPAQPTPMPTSSVLPQSSGGGRGALIGVAAALAL